MRWSCSVLGSGSVYAPKGYRCIGALGGSSTDVGSKGIAQLFDSRRDMSRGVTRRRCIPRESRCSSRRVQAHLMRCTWLAPSRQVQRCLSPPMIGYDECCNETRSSPPFCRKKPSQNWSTGMRTDSELRAEGMSARINARGLVEAERFIASLSRESFDYTEWWCPHLPLMSVAQISAAASGEH